MKKIVSDFFWFFGTMGAVILARTAYNSGDYVVMTIWIVVVGSGLAFALCRS